MWKEVRSVRRVQDSFALPALPRRHSLPAASARDALIEDPAYRGLLNPLRRRGRWSEKFLTLTAPPKDESIRGRIALVLNAWARFLKRLNTELRRLRAGGTTEWLRVLEWTSGDDGKGHPHIHVWLFSPFLSVELLRDFWRDSLAEEGCVVERPVIHIEEVDNPGRAVPRSSSSST